MNKKFIGFLQLMRPANIVTSVADVLAGVAIAGFFTGWGFDNMNFPPVLMLCLSTAGLYGGGVVFNDVFDAGLDKTERPERPIPSGLIPIKQASILGFTLLVIGILSAFFVNNTSGSLAAAIAFFALVYDKWGKHQLILGPLNMGFCRGLNLLLGISVSAFMLPETWYTAFIPVIYIASITMISRGEVHGGNRITLYSAATLYGIVLLSILIFSYVKGNMMYALFFLIILGYTIYKPLLKAIKEPIGSNIGKAVKSGVIMLIVMNAAWAAASGALYAALMIFFLLPVSIVLARIFAVT